MRGVAARAQPRAMGIGRIGVGERSSSNMRSHNTVTTSAEYLDSHGHRLAQSNIVNALLQRGLVLQRDDGIDGDRRIIRDNRRQLTRDDQRDNRQVMPDVSYRGLVNGQERRV